MKTIDPIRDICPRFPALADLTECKPFGNGHINGTYHAAAGGKEYTLQMLNRTVFPKPEQVIENIALVTAHIAEKLKEAGEDPARGTLHLVPAADGKNYVSDENGNVWRLYHFIDKSYSIEIAETDEEFGKTGEAFGRFQRYLADFPAEKLHEVIAHFHDTPKRYRDFLEAVEKDAAGRADACRAEIDFIRARADFYTTLTDAHARGELPLRVTHNDTKLTNILFDEVTRLPLCVIDLDTVMPGFSVTDFGDAIRFGASTAVEDERDLSKVHFSLSRYKAYLAGYLAGAGDGLTAAEKRLLPEGALMMTLECGMRFLADHLNGDVYFRIHREGHNLDRCRTQLRLAAEMEEHLEEMRALAR